MPHLKIRDVLAQVDDLLPNQYTVQQKQRWVQQAEGLVITEILGEEMPEDMTEDTVLCAEPPYDEMYRHFVEAQIHYANDEIERYNNASVAWNSLFAAFHDHCIRARRHEGGSAALKLC